LKEEKPKRKFMNPKGKKFKKPNHFFFLHMQPLFLSKLLNLPPSNPKSLARRPMEDSTILWENESFGTSMFQPKEGTSQSTIKRKGRTRGQHGGIELKLF